MARFNYVLSFNSFSSSPTADQLQIFISQNRDIESWYLAFPGTYILKSDKVTTELWEQFQKIFSGTPFLLTYAHLATGALPTEVWQWFNNLTNPFLPGS
jgi:hypothetical protein